jgi:putative ABC transport system permease protein
MIPLKYNTRNLRERWITTILTVLGTGLVVWSSCLLFSLVDGLQHSLSISGDPLDLIVLRKGSSNETTGGFAEDTAQQLRTLDGIARDEKGAPLVAFEMLNIPVIERRDGSHTNIIIRGVTEPSPKLRPDFRIVQGRYLESGKGECIVSRSTSRRFKGTTVGSTFSFGGKESYRVVGLFTAGGSAAESEVWVDFKDMAKNTSREGNVSSVQLRATTAAAAERLKTTIENDTRFKLDAVHESDYFARQAMTANFLKAAGTLIAVLLTLEAMFAAANTMFATVGARTREIGTMRALGFSRRDVLVSFMAESVLLCALGGLLGLAGTLPLSHLSFGISNFNTFTEATISFRFGPLAMTAAVVMTLSMGVFGGLFPAIRAVRMEVVGALREL